MRTPLLRRISLRVQVLLVTGFLAGTLLPPYIPQTSLASETGDGTGVEPPQFEFVEDGFLMKTSTLSPQGTQLASGEGQMHVVQEGETIGAIAQRYGISPQTIRWANGLSDGEAAKPGSELLILPVDGVLHTVGRGQTLTRIAQLYDVKPEDIARVNGIEGGYIDTGRMLIIPGGKPILNPEAVGAAPGSSLQFGALPEKNIALNFGPPSHPPPSGGGGGVAKQAPVTQVNPTSGVLQMPCNNCEITQYYHPGHYALDIQTKGGGPVFAAEAGTIIRADYGWDGGYGNVIEIDHGNGLVTLYGHNKELYVKVGDRVSRGQTVSWMGNTGMVYGPTGIHVHFEVRVNGVKKNPLLYLEG